MKLSRRSINRLIFGAPVAAAAAAVVPSALIGIRPAAAQAAAEAAPAEETKPAVAPEPSPLARFLSKQEADLSSEERARIRRKVTDLEQSLSEIRAFKLDNSVPPSGTFRALRARR